MNNILSFLSCSVLLLSFLLPIAAAHGFMNKPHIRGSLVKSKFVPQAFDNDAPKDHWAHFPAGNKNSRPGSGLASQVREAGPKGWTPFTPLDPAFKWRAGVCGDEKVQGMKQPHLQGGEYYYGAKITGTYRQAGLVEVALSIIAHHNGYMELHICDVDKCDGEISESCFREGHCQQLKRAPNKQCDEGNSKQCGPIDRNYPGRWYLPCSTVGENGWEIFGGDTIKYRLPEDLTCEHCVLQWFWTAANTCNPPGVVEYFDGPDGPKNWGNCVGQGGAIGGVTRVQRPCGPNRFPEEYLDCADIRILPRDDPIDVTGLAGETLPSLTQSARPSPLASYSKTPRPSPEPSQSRTPQPSPEPSNSRTPRPSPEPSESKTPQPSPEPSNSRTPRPSPEPSESKTPRPSPEPSNSRTPRPSPEPSESKTPRPSPEPSNSRTPSPSPEPSESKTPRPSPEPSNSRTPSPSPEPSESKTPRPSPTSSRSSTPTPSAKPSRSSAPRPSPKTTGGRAGKASLTPSPSESPKASAVSAMDLELSLASMEPSFSPEEQLEASDSPESELSPEPSPVDFDFNPFEPNSRQGLITDVILVADGKDVSSVMNGDIINIKAYKKIALKVITKREVDKVDFYINGERVWTERYMDYFMFGNSETSPFYWKNPPLDVWTEVTTVAEDEEDVVNVMFTK